MWKLALISWLLFAVLKWLYEIMAHSLSEEEEAVYAISNGLPKRLLVFTGIVLVEFKISVILSIIAIIKL